jgi:hypothetical protein
MASKVRAPAMLNYAKFRSSNICLWLYQISSIKVLWSNLKAVTSCVNTHRNSFPYMVMVDLDRKWGDFHFAMKKTKCLIFICIRIQILLKFLVEIFLLKIFLNINALIMLWLIWSWNYSKLWQFFYLNCFRNWDLKLAVRIKS